MPIHAADQALPSTWTVPQFGAWPDSETEHHVIVIGAGIGGLTVAALLAKRGLKVLVIEAHDRPGGCCTSWTRKVRCRNGEVGVFTFDAGVQDISGLGAKGPLRHLLAQLEATDQIHWHRVGHRYDQDGFQFEMPERPQDLVAALTQQFPDEAEGIAAFVLAVKGVYLDLYADVDVNGGVPTRPSGIKAMAAWPTERPLADRWMLCTWTEFLDHFFQDARLKRLLSVISEYVTDQPEVLTVGEMAPLFGYYFDGGSYPAGGSQRLADVLSANIDCCGGRVMLRTCVTQILLERGSAVGVTTAAGGTHRAPLIISNADFGVTFGQLMDPAILPTRYGQRLRNRKRGPSAFLVSLALDTVPDIPARVFLTTPTLQFGIGNPSVIDPTLAPPGHAVLTMLLLLPEQECANWQAMDRIDYRQRKRALINEMITAAEAVIPGLRQTVLYQQAGTPRTAKRYLRTENGCIYGAARRQWSPGVQSPIPGLMLVGGGGRLGPGIEPVTISGMTAAQLVLSQAGIGLRARA